jgi:hypothetical protein
MAAAERFDMVRLAEMRDAHAALVTDYQRSVRAVSDAATEASRARLDAPPLPGAAPQVPRAIFAPGIGTPPKPAPPPAPRTNEFYLQPLATMLSFTQTQLEDAGIDQRALSKIIVAENRLNKLRAAHATKADAVRQSADAMKHINLFATENRL